MDDLNSYMMNINYHTNGSGLIRFEQITFQKTGRTVNIAESIYLPKLIETRKTRIFSIFF